MMADVVGYSRLMGLDEEDTIERIKICREIFAARVSEHAGRIVNAPGDSILAEFASVKAAVTSAVEIQNDLAEFNRDTEPPQEMRFRIGINLGDVVVEDDAIYGNGINVAARLESLADHGGITISGSVYDSVRDQLPLGFEFTGEQSVKNITNPVRTYRIKIGDDLLTQSRAEELSRKPTPLLLVSILVIILLALLTTINWSTFQSPNRPEIKSNSSLKQTPSIAVRPFQNISGDPEQGYFSRGLTETLIASLSNLRDLTVISSDPAEAVETDSIDVRELGTRFGVQHVLDGSVQKAGDRVRINVQLLETKSGAHIWAEKYDRELKDIFELQDEITSAILAELDVTLVEGEQSNSWRSSTKNAQAYELFLKGWEARELINKEDNNRAKRFFTRALELDPNFTAAVFGLGTTHMSDAYSGWSESPAKSFETAIDLAKRAIELEPTFGGAYDLLGELTIMYQHDHSLGIENMRKAVDLTPNSARYNWTLGVYLCNAEKTLEGLEYVERGFRLNPHPPSWFHEGYGRCYLVMKEFESSIQANLKAIANLPDFIWGYVELAIAYMGLGDSIRARQAALEILRIDPNFSVDTHPSIAVLINPDTQQEFRKLLRSSGLH